MEDENINDFGYINKSVVSNYRVKFRVSKVKGSSTINKLQHNIEEMITYMSRLSTRRLYKSITVVASR